MDSAPSGVSRLSGRAHPLRAAAIVLELDLRAPYRVLDGFGPLPDVLVDHELLLDLGLLGDHRLLRALRGVERALAVVLVHPGRAVHRAALDVDALLAKVDLLLNRRLDHVGADAHPAALDLALADPQVLLDDRDRLLAA